MKQGDKAGLETKSVQNSGLGRGLHEVNKIKVREKVEAQERTQNIISLLTLVWKSDAVVFPVSKLITAAGSGSVFAHCVFPFHFSEHRTLDSLLMLQPCRFML